VNATLDVPTQGVVRPYVIAGIGMYKSEFEVSFEGVSGSFDDTRVGFNGGAGVRFGLGGLAAFVEARYHTTTIEVDLDDFGTSGSQRISFIPVSFGIQF
jgi:opacity protein-like surface antigen